MYDALKAFAHQLIHNMDKRDMYAEIKIADFNSPDPSPDNGVYIVFGCDETAVQNTAFNPFYMVEEYDRQNLIFGSLYPKCMVYKVTDTKLATASDFCNRRDAVHLIWELFPRYNMKVPEFMTQNDFLAIARCYFETLDMKATYREREYAKQYLENMLKITDSGLKQEKYEEKHGIFSILKNKKTVKEIRKAADQISNSTVTYISKASNCVSDSDLKTSGRACMSVNIDHEILSEFEKDMEQYPNIMYSLDKIGKPYVYGEIGYKYWHMLTFPLHCEKIITGIMHKHEKNLSDISKKYTPGRRNISATEVLATDFNQIYEHALEHDITFYLDEKSVYARNTTERIGIVTEDEYNEGMLQQALLSFVKSKIHGTYLDEDPVYQQKLESKEILDALRRGVAEEMELAKKKKENV